MTTASDAAETLAVTRLVLDGTVSHEGLLGHEGMASREYFRAWRRLIGEAWGFTARERRPSADPVNAVLSFGYSMLAQEAATSLEGTGLDATVGFLHRACWGRPSLHWTWPSLAPDLMEGFRP
jgi:CRISPR-associated protein Cas1